MSQDTIVPLEAGEAKETQAVRVICAKDCVAPFAACSIQELKTLLSLSTASLQGQCSE